MLEQELQRYSRQIKLPQVGVQGQQTLLDARVLIIGMGGLGSPVALYLAAAGIGHLVISDFDHVDVSNLQRQIVHSQSDLGSSKASSAKASINALNPNTKVDIFDYELDDDDLATQVKAADVIVDCSDNFPTRFELNRCSIKHNTPLVSGAAIRWEGQVSSFDPNLEDSPCYRCLYPDTSVETVTCAAEGVIAPVVGVIGTLQSLEVINQLLQNKEALTGRLLLFDGVTMEFNSIGLPKNPKCPDCGDSGDGGERD